MRQERRQWTRIRPTQLVYVELGADNGGMVRDISETGIGFCAVRAVAGGEKITFVFTLEAERRLEGNAQSAWTDVTGKVGGLRFLEVSDEFRRELHGWLRGNSVPAGSVAQHAPAAATPMDRMERPPREPLRELLKPAKEGHSKALRANAMRLAVDAAAAAEKKEPAPRRPLDTPVLSYEVSEVISREVKPRLPRPAIVEQARETSPRGDANVLRAASAMFVVMLLVILFLFPQGAGEGLIWLGKKIAGEPRALPIQQSDGQEQTPSPRQEQTPSPSEDTSQVDTHKERESGAETVRLLWAEVARGKISAEVVLADMYVHGDRVPKNCAQARILLSAAAKKGNEIAVRKLIDLDSEGGGCSNSARQ